jgi:histidinol-phosphate aminotransferase
MADIKINRSLISRKGIQIAPYVTNVINLATIDATPDTPDIRYNRYLTATSSYNELHRHIREYVNHDNVLITNGAGRGLELIINAFTNKGTNILIPTPNYKRVIHHVQTSAGNCICVKFDGNDPQKIEDNIKYCNIIYMSNPNLPLGYMLNDELERWIRNNPTKLFIIDESYYEYGNGRSCIPLIKECHNVVVVRTFSKAFALAGARIGYIVADESLMKTIRICHHPNDVLDYSVEWALAAMINKEYYIDNVRIDTIMKEGIALELKRLTSMKNNIIYDCICGHGPWILLLTHAPATVCGVFLDANIKVKNISQDTPNTIFIALGQFKHMCQVVEIVARVNHLPSSRGYSLDHER